jgi:hypothetical protein
MGHLVPPVHVEGTEDLAAVDAVPLREEAAELLAARGAARDAVDLDPVAGGDDRRLLEQRGARVAGEVTQRSGIASGANASRSRSANGAVVWSRPASTSVAARPGEGIPSVDVSQRMGTAVSLVRDPRPVSAGLLRRA